MPISEISSQKKIVEIEKAITVTSEMHKGNEFCSSRNDGSPGGCCRSETALAAGDLSFPILPLSTGNFFQRSTHTQRAFLLDAGYETPLGYAGDMSSTFPVSEKFTERQKEIYRITLEAHNHAIKMAKPNVNFKDVHLHVCETIFDGLKALGFTKGNTQEAVANGAHALFFPCGTGHLMGLDVHDMENLGEVIVGYDNVPKSTQFGLKSLRLGRPLELRFCNHH